MLQFNAERLQDVAKVIAFGAADPVVVLRKAVDLRSRRDTFRTVDASSETDSSSSVILRSRRTRRRRRRLRDSPVLTSLPKSCRPLNPESASQNALADMP